MTITMLVKKLKELGIYLELKDNNLSCQGNIEYLDEELLALLRNHKQSLILMLRESVRNERKTEIQPLPENKEIPCTSAQQRLWIAEKISGKSSYNVPVAYRFDGELDIDKLDTAISLLQQRHPILASRFKAQNGKLLLTGATHPTRLEIRQVEYESQARALIDEFVIAPFDLEKDVPFRAVLYTNNTTHWFAMNLHHIVTDGWSMGILFRDLNEIYKSIQQNAAPNLPDLEIGFRDYIHWHNTDENKTNCSKQLAYWRSQLEGLPHCHSLATDYVRNDEIHPKKSSIYRTEATGAMVTQLTALATGQRTTLFIVLQSAFALLLSRWSRQDDIVMGVPTSGRDDDALSQMIGYFVNTLVLRSNIDPNASFSEQVSNNSTMVLDAFSNQDLDFEQLVETLQPDRQASVPPLFQIMFAMQNNSIGEVRFGECDVAPVEFNIPNAKFDLTLNLAVSDQELQFAWEYDTSLFDATSIARLADSFIALLKQVAEDPERPQCTYRLWLNTSEIPCFESQQPKNNVSTSNVWTEFSAIAQKYPTNVAWRDGTHTYNYSQLHQKAVAVAAQLQSKQITSGCNIAIILPRGLKHLLGVLAASALGACYVPIDPKYPQERIEFIVEDSQADLVIVDKLSDLQLPGSCVEFPSGDEQQISHSFTGPASSEAPAYLMYTSGTSGQPKGVRAPHKAILRLVKNTEYINFDQHIVMAHSANICFDAATFEIWGALLNGGCLILVPDETLLNPQALEQVIVDNKITTQFFTTALFNRLADLCPRLFSHLTECLLGGEAVTARAVNQVFEHTVHTRLINVYGPTENTTFSTYARLDSRQRDPVPIGIPINQSGVLVVDGQLQPTAPGAIGELLVSGCGLALDYWRKNESTNTKFVTLANGARAYRTGDLVRWNSKNQLVYIGRMDEQVKIRGFRIELQEISNLLQQSPDVHTAAVLVKEQAGNKVLAAFFVTQLPETQHGELEQQLRQLATQQLPTFMHPISYTMLEQLPLTANGKLDSRKLLAIESKPRQPTQQTHNLNETEAEISQFFADALGTEIPPDTHFFNAGGNSLMAMELIHKINETFHIKLDITDIFKYVTIRLLAEKLDEASLKQALSDDMDGLLQDLEDMFS